MAFTYSKDNGQNGFVSETPQVPIKIHRNSFSTSTHSPGSQSRRTSSASTESPKSLRGTCTPNNTPQNERPESSNILSLNGADDTRPCGCFEALKIWIAKIRTKLEMTEDNWRRRVETFWESPFGKNITETSHSVMTLGRPELMSLNPVPLFPGHPAYQTHFVCLDEDEPDTSMDGEQEQCKQRPRTWFDVQSTVSDWKEAPGKRRLSWNS
jgi:hypothetical protein